MISKTIICKPEEFDTQFNDWYKNTIKSLVELTENKENKYGNYITSVEIQHFGEYHYIIYQVRYKLI